MKKVQKNSGKLRRLQTWDFVYFFVTESTRFAGLNVNQCR